MIVRVPDIPTEGLSVTDVGALGPVYRDPTWRLERVELRLARDGVEVFVTGELSAAVSQACGRCLQPLPVVAGSAPPDGRLIPRPATAASVADAPHDPDVGLYQHDGVS